MDTKVQYITLYFPNPGGFYDFHSVGTTNSLGFRETDSIRGGRFT
jgi:hypothetical protein